MKTIIDNRALKEKTAVCLGNFDGIHIGHQSIISEVKKQARKYNIDSVMFSFKIHPENYMWQGIKTKLITDEMMKEKILSELGLDVLYLHDFNQSFKDMTPLEFVEEILIKHLNASVIVAGFNYRFGKNRKGDCEILKSICEKNGVKVKIIPAVYLEDKIVSSTVVRRLLSEGEIEEANRCLGRFYSVMGKVVKGRQIGSKKIFPTANIMPKKELVYPKKGVYVTKTVIDGKTYESITNIGNNPTVGGSKITIETHFLDLKLDTYDKIIDVKFMKNIRKEMTFDSVIELKNQIKKDIVIARSFFEGEEA